MGSTPLISMDEGCQSHGVALDRSGRHLYDQACSATRASTHHDRQAARPRHAAAGGGSAAAGGALPRSVDCAKGSAAGCLQTTLPQGVSALSSPRLCVWSGYDDDRAAQLTPVNFKLNEIHLLNY